MSMGAFTRVDTRRGGTRQARSKPGKQSVNEYWTVWHVDEDNLAKSEWTTGEYIMGWLGMSWESRCTELADEVEWSRGTVSLNWPAVGEEQNIQWRDWTLLKQVRFTGYIQLTEQLFMRCYNIMSSYKVGEEFGVSHLSLIFLFWLLHLSCSRPTHHNEDRSSSLCCLRSEGCNRWD